MKIQIHSRYMSDPFLSDIDFKNKMSGVYTTLKSLKAKSFNFVGYKLYGPG